MTSRYQGDEPWIYRNDESGDYVIINSELEDGIKTHTAANLGTVGSLGNILSILRKIRLWYYSNFR